MIAHAVEMVASSSTTWLRADLAREIAARLPAEVAASAADVVRVVDELAERASEHCVELHPRPRRAGARRHDGRPVTEHVVDRRLTTPALLEQEAGLLRWARANVGLRPPSASDDEPQVIAARDVAGCRRLVLVVGPAGAGKTTMLAGSVAELRDQQRAVMGLAPSGKAADGLARETGSTATTVAKLLHEYGRVNGPQPEWRLPPATTLILDEAGMASTDDLARLVALADRHDWRLVCVGDPAQLPAVGRGGIFAHWCAILPAHHLEKVRRFAEAWQAEASLVLRQGDPAAAALYARHRRLRTVHPALIADRVARQYERHAEGGGTVAITTASTGTARAINLEIQRRRHPRQLGPSVTLADGTSAFVGDRVATRRNDAGLVATGGTTVRNRQTWTVTAIGDDGSLTLADGERGSVQLPSKYVARHVELGWAVTGYGNQGTTVDHGICVIEPASTRAGIYVAMTRGRSRNVAWIVDRNGTDDAEVSFAGAIARPPNAGTAHAMRDRLYRAAGVAPPTQTVPTMTDEDPARRMAERLNRLPAPARRPPGLSR
jgi:ATP-dependent exoDNAse (exonuclease V) alpha subunit